MNRENLIMTIFAGTNGAGKSTLSKQMITRVGTIIDPDAIAKRMNPSNPREADLAAGKEAVRTIRQLIAEKRNFAIETTLSGTFALRHIHLAKQRGYSIVLYYIGLRDVQMHIDRVASRVEQGGHWIAEEDIRWRYGQSLNNLTPAIELADRVIIIDNTSSKPVIVAEIERPKIKYMTTNPPKWAATVLDMFQ